MSVLVADTGDVDAIRQYKPTDATTNPSLLLKAATMPKFAHLLDEAISYGKRQSGISDSERIDLVFDRLSVNFGTEITKIVPGLVSVEVDASIAFKPQQTADRARRMIGMFAEKGVPKERILIKVASTWYGIKAAEQLEKEGISCNLTLIFNLEAQAAACAEAKVTLISPFVGRVSDWQKANVGPIKDIEEDMGVQLVRGIYDYYKKYGYNTVVMAASFRNKDQITALAGCDKITISPKLLQELKDSDVPVPRKLKAGVTHQRNLNPPCDDTEFYARMCKDAMALEKLHDGIRRFEADGDKLKKFIADKLAASGRSRL